MRLKTISIRFFLIVSVFVVQVCVAGQNVPSKTVLTDCNVIDCTGNKPMKNMTVVISGNWITEIKRGLYQTSDAQESVEVIDLDGAYVLPGFWNMHVHMASTFPGNPNLSGEFLAATVIRAGLNAMDGLRDGFTAIRTVGEREYLDAAWRDVFDYGFFMGPRIFASGSAVGPTAGHRGDAGSGYDGVPEIRKAVRSRIQKGVNLIKLMGDVEMFPDELDALIQTAHSFGIHVASHSREPGTYRFVQAGGDCVEHGYGLSDETIKLMAKKGTFYDPTIICNLSDQYIKERESRLAKLGYSENEEVVKWRTHIAYGDQRSPEHALHQRKALQKAAKAGVKLLIGSDSNPIGEIGILEIEQFVLSGVSEMETLIAATRNGAEMCGVLDILGTVEEGKLADLVVVAENPLENISNIRKVKMVFKDGVSVDLTRPLGTASYWEYFDVRFPKKGYLGDAENVAGFRRGKAEPPKK